MNIVPWHPLNDTTNTINGEQTVFTGDNGIFSIHLLPRGYHLFLWILSNSISHGSVSPCIWKRWLFPCVYHTVELYQLVGEQDTLALFRATSRFVAAFCNSSSLAACPTDINNFIVCSEVCTWLSSILSRRSSMSLLGRGPCCWPLPVTSGASGTKGCGSVLTGREVGMAGASVSGLEWGVGGTGGAGRWPKLLGGTASVLTTGLAPAWMLCVSGCPGHLVLCGGENIPLESLRSRHPCTALFCGLSSHCTTSISHFLLRRAQESKINLHILSLLSLPINLSWDSQLSLFSSSGLHESPFLLEKPRLSQLGWEWELGKRAEVVLKGSFSWRMASAKSPFWQGAAGAICVS